MTIYVPPRFPQVYVEDFANGIGNWTAGSPVVGGPREVVDGVFRSHDWGYDNNHLTTKGGPGMLHLMAYADSPLWNYGDANGNLICCDFINAKIKLRARGVNFNPNGSEFIVWITANHPYRLHTDGKPKNVNWGFYTEPRTSQLTSGNWEDIEWLLDPDPAKWVWGKGQDGGLYDTFLSLQECLQNICNIHFPTLGPDNVGHPTGTFELDRAEFTFNRNGPGLAGFRWGAKAPAVTLSAGDLTASHAAFSSTGGVRSSDPLPNGSYWETKHLAGTMSLCFASGICSAAYNPVVSGGTFFADLSSGWGFLLDRGAKRHNGSDTSWGPSSLPSGVTLMHALKDGNYWQGANGTWFNSGNPATGANPMFTGLSGDLYACESNGTGNGSWVWRTNFGGEAFTYTPPSGFAGPSA